MQEQPEGAVDTYFFAKQYDLPSLAESCESFIANNWKKINSSPSGIKKTEELSKDNLRSILDKIGSTSGYRKR
jgi:hypothetical protein